MDLQQTMFVFGRLKAADLGVSGGGVDQYGIIAGRRESKDCYVLQGAAANSHRISSDCDLQITCNNGQ